MPKNALFFLKNRKDRRALGTQPPDLRNSSPMTNSWLRAWMLM